MKRHVYDATGATLIRTEEATPTCGEHFCDTCGDCLVCYPHGGCMPNGQYDPGAEHYWVQYGEEPST